MRGKDARPKEAGPGATGATGAGGKGGSEASPSFEEMMERLEGLVGRLEEGNLSLEDSIRSFEEGVQLVKRCTAVLEEAERRIQKLTRDAEGNPAVAPMPASAPAPVAGPAPAPMPRSKEADEGRDGELPF